MKHLINKFDLQNKQSKMRYYIEHILKPHENIQREDMFLKYKCTKRKSMNGQALGPMPQS